MAVISIFVDANKTGAAQEAINGIKRAGKTMTEQEAWQILGISEQSTWEEITKVCDIVLPLNIPLQRLFSYHILYLG
jgi:mitochondrial import inner membrane translocase subunit TIM16